MKNNYIFIILLVLNCIISAFSQVLLKKSSLKNYSSFIRQYLNLYVITGYGLFFLVLIVNIYLLRFIPVTISGAISESLPLVFSFVTGFIFFKEKITKWKLIGGFCIIIGIILILI